MSAINLRRAAPEELPWINQKYDEVSFIHSSLGDWVAVAEINNHSAGLGRLVFINNQTWELGGMYVFEAFRNRGVAKAIVHFLLQQKSSSNIYCIPFSHLASFYQACGFKTVTPTERTPQKILDKWEWCQCHYSEETILMLYQP